MRSVRLRNRFRLGLAAFLRFGSGDSVRSGSAARRPTTPLRSPAQKDSPTRARPKDATLSVSVEPAEARPGDTVTLKVTAKLSPGWHIYTQAKTQDGDGPRKTVLDLFDTAGLEVAGDWKASRKPESKAEPAFENQVFEYFEDEVTWSIPLKVPASASPGQEVHSPPGKLSDLQRAELQLPRAVDAPGGHADRTARGEGRGRRGRSTRSRSPRSPRHRRRRIARPGSVPRASP